MTRRTILRLEQLEQRQLLAADLLSSTVTYEVDGESSVPAAIAHPIEIGTNTPSSTVVRHISPPENSGAPLFIDQRTAGLQAGGDFYFVWVRDGIAAYTVDSESNLLVQTDFLAVKPSQATINKAGTRLIITTQMSEFPAANLENFGKTVVRLVSIDAQGKFKELDRLEADRSRGGASYDIDTDQFILEVKTLKGNLASDPNVPEFRSRIDVRDVVGRHSYYIVDSEASEFPKQPVAMGYDIHVKALDQSRVLVSDGDDLFVVDSTPGATSTIRDLKWPGALKDRLIPHWNGVYVPGATDSVIGNEFYYGGLDRPRLTGNGIAIQRMFATTDDPFGAAEVATVEWDSDLNFVQYDVHFGVNYSQDFSNGPGGNMVSPSALAAQWQFFNRTAEFVHNETSPLVASMFQQVNGVIERVDGSYVLHELEWLGDPAGKFALDENHVVGLTVDYSPYPTKNEVEQTGEVLATLYTRNDSNQFVASQTITLGTDFSPRMELSLSVAGWVRQTAF